jgi:hypothetical protein
MTRISVVAAGTIIGLAALPPQTAQARVAPWCAVQEIWPGSVSWGCSYWTLEECVPEVIAGNRGFCNQNPYWQVSWPRRQQRKRRSRR